LNDLTVQPGETFGCPATLAGKLSHLRESEERVGKWEALLRLGKGGLEAI
jgi:hypothetical protein